MHSPSLDLALAKAARYCAFKERAPLEVITKLKKWSLSDSDIDTIITRLKKENYLDEVRFARAFCHDKFEFNRWGRIKIRMAISRYCLDEEVINKGMEQISTDDYLDVLTKLATKKKDTTSEPDGFKKKQKVAGYLINKGFEMDLVFSTLNKMSFP